MGNSSSAKYVWKVSIQLLHEFAVVVSITVLWSGGLPSTLNPDTDDQDWDASLSTKKPGISTEHHNMCLTPLRHFCRLRTMIMVHGLPLRGFGITHWTHSVGLLRRSDKPVAGTSTWTHTVLKRHKRQNFHIPGEIRTYNLRKRVAADPRLRPAWKLESASHYV